MRNDSYFLGFRIKSMPLVKTNYANISNPNVHKWINVFHGLPSFKVPPEGGCCVFQPTSRSFSRRLLVDIELDRRTETSRPK